MMKYRNFVVLLVGVVMLMSAWVSTWKKTENDNDTDYIRRTAVQEREVAFDTSECFWVPTEYQEVQSFGASYSETLGQWTLQTQMMFSVDSEAIVYAPLSGKIEKIESLKGGGSCIFLNCSGILFKLSRVYDVCVFSGSSVHQGERLGKMLSFLSISAEQDGQMTDPKAITIEPIFLQNAGMGQGIVE